MFGLFFTASYAPTELAADIVLDELDLPGDTLFTSIRERFIVGSIAEDVLQGFVVL